jgi:V/A-type H+-transporting ATPase subunit K
MNFIRTASIAGKDPLLLFSTGIFAGLAIGLSAWMQGRAAAAASDALAETGKGTANYFIVIGIIETVALFTLVFSLLLIQ